MKTVASLLAGTSLAVGMLLGGVVLASAVIVPQEDVPRFTGLDVKDLWTLTPVRVDPHAQAYERIAPRYSTGVVMASSEPNVDTGPVSAPASAVAEIDVMQTSAVTDIDNDGRNLNPLAAAHVAWCEARYKSYRATDNNYISYSGGMKPCISPHGSAPASELDQQAQPTLVQDVAEQSSSVSASSLHAQNCLKRYRSYRPEDNSYQPYGGGPRKQCELRSF